MMSAHGCEFAQNVRATGINIMHTDSRDRFVGDTDALRHADPARPQVLTLGSLPAAGLPMALGGARQRNSTSHSLRVPFSLQAWRFVSRPATYTCCLGFQTVCSSPSPLLPDCSLLTQSAFSRLFAPLPVCSFLGLNQCSFLP